MTKLGMLVDKKLAQALSINLIHFTFRLWLFQMAQGVDLEAVTPRFASKSIGCCKKFPGRNSIKGIATLTHWLNELATEIVERLEKDEIENSRVAKQIVVSFTQKINTEEVASTRCVALNNIDVETIAQDALDVIKKNTAVFFKNEQNTVIASPITLLGISAGKFDDNSQQKRNTIKDLFSKAIISEAAKKAENVSNESVDDGPAPSHSAAKRDSKTSNIKSFFTVVKGDAKGNYDEDTVVKGDAKENDDEDLFSDNDFDCNSNSSEEMPINAFVGQVEDDVGITDAVEQVEDDVAFIVVADSTPVQEIAPTEVNHPISRVESNDISEKIVKETTPPPETNSSSHCSENIDFEQPGPSNQADYRSNYLEYLRPEIPDEFFETCPQCHKKLLVVEMQSHADMHLAFQLSEEQRLEYRSQLKTKSSSTPVAKKPKLDRNAHLNSSTPSGSKVIKTTDPVGALTKYFVPKKVEVPESSVKCDECGKFIPIESVAEHSDYHTARKLQMEINSPNMASEPLPTGSAISKNPKVKSRTDPATVKKRSIASFFKAAN